LTVLRPDIVRIFSAAVGKEILRPGTIGSSEVVTSFSRGMNSILIYNAGPNNVFFDFDASVTVASGMIIPLRAWWSGDVPVTSVHLICSSGESATVYIIGFLLR